MSETKTSNVVLGKDHESLIHWGLRILFFLFAWIYLGVVKDDFLFKLQESNYFLQDSLFIKDLLAGKSGLIVVISRFILQFCYYPLLGAGIIALLLSCLEVIISKTFAIKKEWRIIGFIPSIAFLYLFASVTYELYDIFEASYGITNIIGFYYALLLFVIYRKINKSIIGVAILTIITAITTIWMGPSAMVAILMFGADAFFKKRFIQGGVSLALGAIVTYVTAQFSSYHITPAYIGYSMMHPWPIAYYSSLFAKTIVAHAVVVLSLTSLQLYHEKSIVKSQTYVNAIACIVLMAAIVLGCRYPKALGEEFKLQRLTHQAEWKQMVKEMDKMDISTRAIAGYRAVALAATKQLEKKLFNYNYDFYRTNFYKYCEETIYYPDLLFYASFPQISYRWCMEYITDVQKNMQMIKMMALTSFVNEEYELSRRYLNLLSKSMFYKEWANELLGYLDKPEKYYEKYPYLMDVKGGRPQDDRSGLFNCIAVMYDRYRFLPFVTAQKRWMTLLYRRHLDQLESEILKSPYMTRGEMPRCIQEGLILKALLTGDKSMLKQFPINREVYEYVSEFKNYYVNHHNDENLALKMKKKFGYSYCHYFAFGIGSTDYTNKGKINKAQ